MARRVTPGGTWGALGTYVEPPPPPAGSPPLAIGGQSKPHGQPRTGKRSVHGALSQDLAVDAVCGGGWDAADHVAGVDVPALNALHRVGVEWGVGAVGAVCGGGWVGESDAARQASERSSRAEPSRAEPS
jgi:hypothetical protein